MRKVAIVTDDTCDIPPEYIKEYDLFLAPIKVIFSDKVFQSCGVIGDLTLDEYYKRLEAEVPTTSTTAPGMLYTRIDEALKIADSVICIFISNHMSPVANNTMAVINQHFPDKEIKVFDSGVTSVGLASIVLEAAKLAKNGESFKTISTKVEEWVGQLQFAGIMFTLENLVRTGRVPKTKKFMADFFKVKPIVKFVDGEVSVRGKIRANEKVILNQMKKFGKKAIEHLNGETDTIFIGHTRWPEAADEIKAHMAKHNPNNKKIIIQETGAIVSNYVGRKTMTIGYIGQYDEDWLADTKN